MSIIQSLPTNEEALAYIQEARKSSAEMNKLIETYKILVKVNANNFKNYTSLPLYDLEQEGYIGLMHAANRYDPSYNTKFTTWAILTINRYMQKAVTREKKHSFNFVSIDCEKSDAKLILGITSQENSYAESLSSASKQFDIKTVLTDREAELIKVRYNLEV